MAESDDCAEVRAVLPELAAGVAPGDVRARALVHIAGCPECRRELEDLAGVVDELLGLAPEHEPPVGFEARVLAEIEPSARRHGHAAGLLAAAAVLMLAVGGGLVWWQGSGDRAAADEYRQVLSVADGTDMRAADLALDGSSAGSVFVYQGRPSWVFMAVDGIESGTYHVRMVTTDGESRWIGECQVRNGSGSWGTTVDVPLQRVAQVVMYASGLPTLSADFRDA